MAVQAQDIEAADGAHVVKFCEHDAELLAGVGSYVAAAIHADEAALVIATAPHRAALESALDAHGVDLDSAKARGRLLWLDAATTLSELRTEARIDHDAFRELIAGALRSAAADGRPVRACGEIVALLWDDRDVLAAIELDKLWHALGRELPFTVFCPYPTTSVGAGAHAQELAKVRRLHSSVLSAMAEHGTRSPAANAQTGISAAFDAELDSPGRARRLVVDALRSWGAANTLVDDVALVVSELATNAVRHADSSFSVSVSACGSMLRVVVHDSAPLPGTVSDAWLIPQPLHGLSLVDALCRRWGVESSRDGKLVWAELPCPAPLIPQAGG